MWGCRCLLAPPRLLGLMWTPWWCCSVGIQVAQRQGGGVRRAGAHTALGREHPQILIVFSSPLRPCGPQQRNPWCAGRGREGLGGSRRREWGPSPGAGVSPPPRLRFGLGRWPSRGSAWRVCPPAQPAQRHAAPLGGGPGWVQGPSRAEAAAGRLTPQACLSWRGLPAPHGRLSQGGRGPGGRLQLSLPCAALPGLRGHRQPPPVRPWPPRWPWAHWLSTGAGPSASGPWSGQVGAHGLCVALTGPGPYPPPSQGSVPWWQAAALALGLSLSPVPVAC